MQIKHKYLEKYQLAFCFSKKIDITELNITCYSHPAGQPLLMYECKKMINGKYKIEAFQKWIDDLQFTVQLLLKQICFNYEFFDAGEIKSRFQYLQCSQINANALQPKNQLKIQIKSQEKSQDQKNFSHNSQQRQKNLVQQVKIQEKIQQTSQNLKNQLKSQNLKIQPNTQSLKMKSESQALKIQQKIQIQEKSQNSKIIQKQLKAPQNTQIKKQNKRKDYQKNQLKQKKQLQQPKQQKKLQQPKQKKRLQQPKQQKLPNTFKKKQFIQRSLQQIDRGFQEGYTKGIDNKQKEIFFDIFDEIQREDQEQKRQQQQQQQQKSILHNQTYLGDLPDFQKPQYNQEQLNSSKQVSDNMLPQIVDCNDIKSNQQIEKKQFQIQINDHQKFKTCYAINNNVIKVIQKQSKNVFPIIGKLHATFNQLQLLKTNTFNQLQLLKTNTFAVTFNLIPNRQFSVGWIKLTPKEHSNLIQNCPQPQNGKYEQKAYFLNSPSGKIFIGQKKQYQKKMIKYEKGWRVQCKIIFGKENQNQMQWRYFDSSTSERGLISINFEIQKDKKVYYYPYLLAKYCNSQFEIKKQG